jgi:glycosyltransferase involved in cell wall biosynthesis
MKSLTILFVYPNEINPIHGGVEKATFTLANFLESKGYKVLFLGHIEYSTMNDSRQFSLPESFVSNSSKNINFFREFLVLNSVNVIINQSGTNKIFTSFITENNINHTNVVSVLHNSPLSAITNYNEVHKYRLLIYKSKFIIEIVNSKIFLSLVLFLYKLKYRVHYNKLYKKSTNIVLLSSAYISEFNYLLDKKATNKVIAIPNPAPYRQVNITTKKKELLYVGRINTSQKRLDLLLKIWHLLHNRYTDWSLHIVGDGEELKNIKLLSESLKLNNIYFHGECNPIPFYERASVFCMTSSFEGLPMTIIEAMQFGVVPVLFDSFAAAGDLVENGKSGYIVKPFNVDEFASQLSHLMSSVDILHSFSKECKIKVEKFSLPLIGNMWLELFKNLN